MSWKIKAGKSIKCVLMKGYPNTTLGFPRQFCSHLKVTKNFTYLDLQNFSVFQCISCNLELQFCCLLHSSFSCLSCNTQCQTDRIMLLIHMYHLKIPFHHLSAVKTKKLSKTFPMILNRCINNPSLFFLIFPKGACPREAFEIRNQKIDVEKLVVLGD